MRLNLMSGAAALVLLSGLATPVAAQETTGSIRGVISSGDRPVAGARVEIVHTPSGTTTTATSNAEGNFTASGLRPGGPYTVRISSGSGTTEVTDLQVSAGQPLILPVRLEAGNAVDEVVVVANRALNPVTLSTGPGTVFDQQSIGGVASVSRDVRDIARRDPLATMNPSNRSISIAGQGPRLNRFSVDGARLSDNFGNNTGGLPTLRGPVPFDAVEQLSIKVAPSDISEGDFQGAAVNLTLKSGGNRFTGTAFYSYTDDKLTGDRTKGQNIDLNFTSRQKGAFLSGPIIKDKLFFAASFEDLSQTEPAAIGLAGAPNVVPGLTAAQFDQVSAIAKSVYGYDTLGVFSTARETDRKYTGKLDWNISNDQRLSLTYIRNEGAQAQQFNSSISPGSPSLSYRAGNAINPQTVNSVVSQLNSNWTSNFHTEVRLNYRTFDNIPEVFGVKTFGSTAICLDPNSAVQLNGAPNTNPVACSQGTAAAPGAARLFIGAPFTANFDIGNKQYGVDILARLELGQHQLKFIGIYNHVDTRNLFVQNYLGTYYFDSVDDFRNRRASSLTRTGSITGDDNDLTAIFNYEQFTAGVQDTFDVTPDLTVNAGIRVDYYKQSTAPDLNQFFLQRYGFPNNFTIDGKKLVLPRLGLTWRATDRLAVRAGAGLFGGGTPDALITATIQRSGVLGNTVNFARNPDGTCNVPAALCSAALDNVTLGTLSPAVSNYLQTNTAALANASVFAIEKNYKLQSVWKYSLSLDYNANLGPLGDGWRLGGDLLVSDVNNIPIFTDLRAVPNGTLPDGRPRYLAAPGGNFDFLLMNSGKGTSVMGVLRFQKQLNQDFAIGASYTYQHAKDILSAQHTETTAYFEPTVDPNYPTYGTSAFLVRRAVKFNLDYEKRFFGDYHTRLALFGEFRTGTPFSLTMNDPTTTAGRSNVFGTTTIGVATGGNRFLLYVPKLDSMTADPLVVYDSAATFEAFRAFAQANGLKEGQIVGRNSARNPNYNKVDLHFEQELPVPWGFGSRLTLFGDMENVLNLVDSDWGAYVTKTGVVMNVACVPGGGNTCAQYRYSNFVAPVSLNQVRISLWSLRVGARLSF